MFSTGTRAGIYARLPPNSSATPAQ